VHAADDSLRRALVPTTTSAMTDLRAAFLAAMAQRGDDELFVEVTLIDGVNDSVLEATRLVEFLRPFGPDSVKVNLIPYNGACVCMYGMCSL
jgi:adenine C2-methylase RlmN of 23S rRNA A2503 and tRNA A37